MSGGAVIAVTGDGANDARVPGSTDVSIALYNGRSRPHGVTDVGFTNGNRLKRTINDIVEGCVI
jgi:hypothetical protein